MTLHTESHPDRNSEVTVMFAGEGHFQIPGSKDTPLKATLEDWWDKLTGKSWMYSEGNPAAMIYGMRAGFNNLPTDDDVVYVKINNLGHLVHTSELAIVATLEPDTKEN